MSVKIKICGVTRPADAAAAVESGAHAIGFMFFQGSRRYISYEAARAIIRDLPPFVAKVGVFVNAKREEIQRAIEITGIDTLQFHGEEPPEACRGFNLKTIKAFRVQGKDMLALMPRYDVDAWLLDSFVAGERGGTGVTFNWDLAVHARSLGTPIMLAGGLTPENIGRAVEYVQPYAIDVSSGVESAPGKKDPALIATFIENALNAKSLMRASLLRFLCCLVSALAIASTSAADVQRFEILKGIRYYQIGSSGAILQTNNVYRFITQVYADILGNVQGVSLTTPKSQRLILETDADGDPYDYRDKFDDAFDLANNFPNGTYQLGIQTAHDGERTMSFALTGDSYPMAPVIGNYDALQNLAYNAYNEISWPPFAGGTAQDFIQFQIEDALGNNIWETPDFSEPGALNGLDTRFVLPSLTLSPGVVYFGTLRFVKVLYNSNRAYPGVPGTVGYYAQTEFTVRGKSTGLMPNIDRVQLWKVQRSEQIPGGKPAAQPLEMELEARVDAVNSNILARVVLTPPGGTNEIFKTNILHDEFKLSHDFTNDVEFLKVFKSGPYAFDVLRFDDGQESVVIDFTVTNEFPQTPELLNTTTFAGWKITNDLTVSWMPWTNVLPGDFIRVELIDEGDKVWDTPGFTSFKRLDPAVTSVTIPATNFIKGHDYDLLVHFYRPTFADTHALPGAYVFGGFDARTKFKFQTQPPDVLRFAVAEGRYFWQRDEGLFEADTNGPFRFQATANAAASNSLTVAQFSVPNHGVIPLTNDVTGTNFTFLAVELSADALAANYPTGIYQFQFDTRNEGVRPSVVSLSSTQFPPIPKMLNFAFLTSIIFDRDSTLTFVPWQGMDDRTDSIRFTVQTVAGTMVLDSESENPPAKVSTNQVSIDSGTLLKNIVYIARLKFERKNKFENPSYPGARGSASVFSETAFYIATLNFRIDRPVLLPSGDMRFAIQGLLLFRTYALSVSPDFKIWTRLKTVTPTTTSAATQVYTNNTGLDHEFFRWELVLPNSP